MSTFIDALMNLTAVSRKHTLHDQRQNTITGKSSDHGLLMLTGEDTKRPCEIRQRTNALLVVHFRNIVVRRGLPTSQVIVVT